MSANDHPFKVGQNVRIIRARHGWHDGNAKGIVSGVYKNSHETYSYSVKGLGDFEGHDFEIEHTRDLIED